MQLTVSSSIVSATSTPGTAARLSPLDSGCAGNLRLASRQLLLKPVSAKIQRIYLHPKPVTCILNFFQRDSSSINETLAYPRWDMVKIGSLDVAPMGFGTWQWGNQILWGYEKSMDAELQELFNFCVSRGINLIDTADSYGTGKLNGRSEELIGRFLKEYPGSSRVRSSVHVATKFAAYPWRLTSAQMVKACRSSMDRLGVDKIGLGQLHWSASNYAPLQEKVLWDGLVGMKEEGLVECVGVSNYGPKQLTRVNEYLGERGVKIATVQVQYSLLSSGKDQDDLKRLCDSLGIRVIAYSPLCLGLLAGKYSLTNLPKGPRGLLFRQLLPGLEPLLTLLNQIAEKQRKTVAQVSLNWCICKGTIPIPGARNVAQAQENLGTLGWKLSAQEVESLDEASAAVPRAMLQNIFQTK